MWLTSFLASATLASACAAQVFCPQTEAAFRPTVNDPNANLFGNRIELSLDGTRLAVGASDEDTDGIPSIGAVYIYSKRQGEWEFDTRLTPNDSVPQLFGRSLAVAPDGNRVWVGAPQITSTFRPITVFDFDGEWVQSSLIHPQSFVGSGSFGQDMALARNGTLLAVSDVGRRIICFFEQENGQWIERDRLDSPQSTASSYLFGQAIALTADGNTLLVANPSYHAGVTTYVGTVYVYRRTASGWENQSRLSPPEIQQGTEFGNDIVLSESGEIAAIGAYRYSSNGISVSGAIFMYDLTENPPRLLQHVVPLNVGQGDMFGARIGFSADSTTLTSAYFYKTRSLYPGAMCTFRRNGDAWHEALTIESPSQQRGEFFGAANAVNADGTEIMVSAPNNRIDGLPTGTVHMFNLYAPAPCDFNNDGGADNRDVFDLADAICGGQPGSICTDFNSDGGADFGDIVQLADNIAGGTCVP